MKLRVNCILAALACLGSGTLLAAPLVKPASATPAAPAAPIHGDYVEARTASVFAGACHYNGEVVTIGHDAVAAWSITAGSWNGVSLTGVRAMAEITSDANLGDSQGIRRCELLIDPAATAAQAAAFADWVGTHSSTLGHVAAVRRGSVSFAHQASEYRVAGDHFGSLDVQSMPNGECCKQPNLVWYSPLVRLDHRKVGYTVSAAYDAGTLADPWQRGDENSAFYGTFTD